MLTHKLLLRAPKGNGDPVMTLPGYMGGDGSMSFLRRYLDKLGYDARPWGLGRNVQNSKIKDMEGLMEFKADMIDKLGCEVERIYKETGRKVSLIGWSLGGLYADGLARIAPEMVRQVITLGTPLGDPRGTSIFALVYRVLERHFEEDFIDFSLWCNDIPKGEREVPTTIVFSKTDGIVSPDIALLGHHPSIRYIKVKSSHVGFVVNPMAYWAVAKELSRVNKLV